MTSPYRLYNCQLLSRQQVSPSFIRITLAGDDLGTVSDALSDQRVKLVLADDQMLNRLVQADDWFETWQQLGEERPPLRTYTLAAVQSPGSGYGTVDIDVFDHPGLASDFARSAPLGSPVGLVAADRTVAGYREIGIGWHRGNAKQVLLIADETALPAVVNILAELPADIVGEAHIEVPCLADTRQLSAPVGVQVVWHIKERGECALTGIAANSCKDDQDEDAEPFWDEGSGDTWYGWIAGESGWVRRGRALAKESGFSPKNMSIMGYWKRGTSLS